MCFTLAGKRDVQFWSASVFESTMVSKTSKVLCGLEQRWQKSFDKQINSQHSSDMLSSLLSSPLLSCPFLSSPVVSSLCAKLLSKRQRSEERRVGKECRSRWSAYH